MVYSPFHATVAKAAKMMTNPESDEWNANGKEDQLDGHMAVAGNFAIALFVKQMAFCAASVIAGEPVISVQTAKRF